MRPKIIGPDETRMNGDIDLAAARLTIAAEMAERQAAWQAAQPRRRACLEWLAQAGKNRVAANQRALVAGRNIK